MVNAKSLRTRFKKSSPLSFVCNICGAHNTVEHQALAREAITCTCGSILRWRSVMAALSESLFDRALVMGEFPRRPEVVGLGMSDWPGYADRLAATFDYTNTFYDRQPRLDITEPVPAARAASYDFIVSSDVLEHVPPPFERALVHCRELLKPGGVLILTVPMKPTGTTDEHYPELGDYQIVQLGPDQVLVNRTASGAFQLFSDLIFHGGPGETLEMRLFSAPDVVQALFDAGFEEVVPFDRTLEHFGIAWGEPWSWPVVARAPRVPGAA